MIRPMYLKQTILVLTAHRYGSLSTLSFSPCIVHIILYRVKVMSMSLPYFHVTTLLSKNSKTHFIFKLEKIKLLLSATKDPVYLCKVVLSRQCRFQAKHKKNVDVSDTRFWYNCTFMYILYPNSILNIFFLF